MRYTEYDKEEDRCRYSDRESNDRRIKAWHATFNAAITGFVLLSVQSGSSSKALVSWAAGVADEAHGKLK